MMVEILSLVCYSNQKVCFTLTCLKPMNYQTFQPHPDLDALIKCYWTLEVPSEKDSQKQRIVPDGCLEMIFILGDDIKRYTSETNLSFSLVQ